MTTFYERRGVTITDEWFVIDDKRYAVAELTNMGVARGPANRTATAAGITAGVLALITGLVWSYIGSATAWVLVLAAIAAPAALGLTLRRLRPASYELWAVHAGATTKLFTSPDRQVFGQVSRALMRATQCARHRSAQRDELTLIG